MGLRKLGKKRGSQIEHGQFTDTQPPRASNANRPHDHPNKGQNYDEPIHTLSERLDQLFPGKNYGAGGFLQFELTNSLNVEYHVHNAATAAAWSSWNCGYCDISTFFAISQGIWSANTYAALHSA